MDDQRDCDRDVITEGNDLTDGDVSETTLKIYCYENCRRRLTVVTCSHEFAADANPVADVKKGAWID